MNPLDPYALYMVGRSMSPRYEPGWLLHINPGRPPISGRDIVIYKRNSEVLIKQFVERTSTELVLKQLNPEETLRLPLSDVAEFHLIVGSDEEGGAA